MAIKIDVYHKPIDLSQLIFDFVYRVYYGSFFIGEN